MRMGIIRPADFLRSSVPAAEALCEGIGDQGFAFASLLVDNDWVPGQPKPTPAPSRAGQVNPAAVHTTMFICLLSGIGLTIIPSSLPRAGPFSSYKSPRCVLV